MVKFKLSKEQPLTTEIIKKLINRNNQFNVPKYQKMDRYYHTENDILRRTMKDESKPNNRVAHPYASYITDILTGYFMGEGVNYNSEDEEALNELTMVLEYNDSQDEDIEIAKDMSIYGVGIELMYIDEEGSTRVKRLEPAEVALVYDDTLNEDLLYGIRYYECEDIVTETKYFMIEVYSDKDVIKYKSDVTFNTLEIIEGPTPHYFGMVPIVVFSNNEEQIGDFEPVISLIDAYDKMESDSLNDFEYFVDAYLCLTGLVADSEDVKQMKENRVLLLDADSDAKWLIKDSNDAVQENSKTRIDKDIHKFSKVPDMSDESFGGNISGVAIKYKTLAMEDIVSIKERKFKKALQRRIELIFAIIAVGNKAFDWRAIDITFTRALPVNQNEVAQMISTLSSIVSNETLLAQVPFVEDAADEQKKVDEEKEKSPWHDVRLGYDGEDEDEEDRASQDKEEK